MSEEELKRELKKAFEKLDLNDKRNEYYNEITYLSIILNSYLRKNGFKELSNTFDYNKDEDYEMTEEKLLTKSYMDIIEIKNIMALLLSYSDEK